MDKTDNTSHETRRDRFYAQFCEWKINAQMADRGRVEDRILPHLSPSPL